MPLSTLQFISKPKISILRKTMAFALDSLLGVRHLSRLYYQYGLEQQKGEAFLQSVIKSLNIKLSGSEKLTHAIPQTGPVVIAANHPFGGLEGVVMLYLILKVRSDVKVLANEALMLFPQLAEWSIFTNPLKANNPKNTGSLRACQKHLDSGGALLIFPAGRVGYYHKDRGRIADHEWNRIVSYFTRQPSVNFCPVHISGLNSPWFYRLGRVWYRFRLLMLVRELTNKHDANVGIHCSSTNNISKVIQALDDDEASSFCRALSYLHEPNYLEPWTATNAEKFAPIPPPCAPQQLLSEVDSLPCNQKLFAKDQFEAYFAQGQQIPKIVREIARCRELIFRMYDEGSGEEIDSDHFDFTYTHLFVVDRDKGCIVGAYRMGQTDKLLADGNLSNLYLSRMFNFTSDFINRQQPCLEMGRSFLLPEYQKTRNGLFILWRAIGAFVVKHPQYTTLYGTVSLSKKYDKRSIKLIERLAVTPTSKVQPKARFDYKLSPEVSRHIEQYPTNPEALIKTLDSYLSFTEHDRKTTPILLRQYATLGAQFHCLGIDTHFADTPGLLLSVDLRQVAPRRLKQYLGESWKDIIAG